MLPIAAAPDAAVVARKRRREIRMVMRASKMAVSDVARSLTTDQEACVTHSAAAPAEDDVRTTAVQGVTASAVTNL
jgi:hypothetical protein